MATLVPFSPKRIEALLDSDDAASLVEAMPVQDLYYLIKDAGIVESSALLALAAPEQVQGFFDLDVWDRDHLDDASAVPWVSALIDAGPERLAFVWRQLDQELTTLILQRWTRIYQLAEEEVPDDEEPPFVPTPDRFYLLKVLSNDREVVSVVERLIDRLYRVDQELARHTIRSAASEPAGELEETAFRWRQNRMSELGYAPFGEALEVYRPLDPAKVIIGEKSADPPADVPLALAVADAVRRPPFLTQVLNALSERSDTDSDDAELRRVESALAVLLNKVLAANRVSPADMEKAQDGAALGAATLSLGLETVARGDVARGALAIATVSLQKLHRVGAGVLAKLQAAARAIGNISVEEPGQSILAGLRLARPQLSRALDDTPRVGVRPFTELADVRRVTDFLANLSLQIELVTRVLRTDPSGFGPNVTIGDVGRTALVRAAIGKGFDVKPISPKDIQDFLRLPQKPALPDVAREFAPILAGWMGDLERALGNVSPDEPPDRRYLAGFLVVESRD